MITNGYGLYAKCNECSWYGERSKMHYVCCIECGSQDLSDVIGRWWVETKRFGEEYIKFEERPKKEA